MINNNDVMTIVTYIVIVINYNNLVHPIWKVSFFFFKEKREKEEDLHAYTTSLITYQVMWRIELKMRERASLMRGKVRTEKRV